MDREQISHNQGAVYSIIKEVMMSPKVTAPFATHLSYLAIK